MTIQIGEKLPDGKLMETTDFDTETHCAMPPKPVAVADSVKDKKIVVFAVPGAFTRTCSAKHLPGFINNLDQIKAKGVDEVWCVSVNDGYVMAHWGKDQNALGKIRFLGDGNGRWAKALGLDANMEANEMGIRSKRFSMLVDKGVVKSLNVDEPGKFEASSAETMLKQLG